MKILESDLYRPLADFFVYNGFEVKGEVKNCDVAAVKEDMLVVCELKTAFCLKLVYQCLERQKAADFVFAVIPRPKRSAGTKAYKRMLALLKRLGIGLITVALDSEAKTVECVLMPETAKKNAKAKTLLLTEFSKRSREYNVGGINRQKILTAYRELAIRLYCICEIRGGVGSRELKEFGIDSKAMRIFRDNFYGWFEKEKRGFYRATPIGKEELENSRFNEVYLFHKTELLKYDGKLKATDIK